MNTLDTLASSVAPIDATGLDQIDGGLLPVIVFLIGLNVGIYGYKAFRD